MLVLMVAVSLSRASTEACCGCSSSSTDYLDTRAAYHLPPQLAFSDFSFGTRGLVMLSSDIISFLTFHPLRNYNWQQVFLVPCDRHTCRFFWTGKFIVFLIFFW